jgi:hypothetical protein
VTTKRNTGSSSYTNKKNIKDIEQSCDVYLETCSDATVWTQVNVVSIKILLNKYAFIYILNEFCRKMSICTYKKKKADPSITLTGSDGADGRRWRL